MTKELYPVTLMNDLSIAYDDVYDNTENRLFGDMIANHSLLLGLETDLCNVQLCISL